MSALARLENWYASHCNGDWEHQWGIRISTLDNPGWRVVINVIGTKAEGAPLDRTRQERAQDDWVEYWVENGKFTAACGPRNLSEVIEIFCDWFDKSA